MEERLFRRKIYAQLLNWKQESDGKSALLVEGARRVGKSTIVETFAKNEYESYLLIDFNKASKAIKDLFNDLMDLDYLFLYLQTAYHVTLKPTFIVSLVNAFHHGYLCKAGRTCRLPKVGQNIAAFAHIVG